MTIRLILKYMTMRVQAAGDIVLQLDCRCTGTQRSVGVFAAGPPKESYLEIIIMLLRRLVYVLVDFLSPIGPWRCFVEQFLQETSQLAKPALQHHEL